MKIIIDKNSETIINYINSKDIDATKQLSKILYAHLLEGIQYKDEVVVLLIGSDRATGDCLGPLVGYKLEHDICVFDDVHVYGTLSHPVHAKNVNAVVTGIEKNHPNSFVIAVDAALGKPESVGFLTIGKGKTYPGASLNRNLKPIGDIFINGIVNDLGDMDMFALQNTRLNLVMTMAEIVHNSLIECFTKFYSFKVEGNMYE